LLLSPTELCFKYLDQILYYSYKNSLRKPKIYVCTVESIEKDCIKLLKYEFSEDSLRKCSKG